MISGGAFGMFSSTSCPSSRRSTGWGPAVGVGASLLLAQVGQTASASRTAPARTRTRWEDDARRLATADFCTCAFQQKCLIDLLDIYFTETITVGASNRDTRRQELSMTDKAISPLPRRLIADMSIRRFGPKTQH